MAADATQAAKHRAGASPRLEISHTDYFFFCNGSGFCSCMPGTIQLQVAAAILTGVLGGLLILDLVVDDGAQAGPVDGLRDRCGRSRTASASESTPSSLPCARVLSTSGFGGLGVHAAGELQRIEVLLALGPIHHLALEVVRP